MHTVSPIEVVDLLGTDLFTFNQKLITDPSFPKPLPSKSSPYGRPPKLFNYDEIVEWGRKHKKGMNTFLAQDAIRGKVWPILKPQPKYLDGARS